LSGNTADRRDRLTVETPALRYDKGLLEPKNIFLAKEVPYTLFVNDREILSISTLPTHLEELFTGFLISEGVLAARSELLECHVDDGTRLVRMELDVPDERVAKLEGRGMLTSGCAGGLVFSVESAASDSVEPRQGPAIRVSPRTILKRMAELDTYPGIYSITRGVHAASVADDEKTIIILEDLGRHNAVDKIAGYCFLHGLETRDKLLLTTGRITSEVLTKAARNGFPIIISRSSASAMAMAMAQQFRVDVVTYVRGGRFNYFHHGAVNLVQDE